MTILVVEDDKLVLETLYELLSAEGYDVLTATNGCKAIEALQKHPVDIMITDIIMPFKEGVETIIECRRQWSNTKIIAISGGGRSARGDFLETARKFGADSILKKPIQPDQLLKAVKALSSVSLKAS